MPNQGIQILFYAVLAVIIYGIGVWTARWVAPLMGRVTRRLRGSHLDEAQLFALYEAQLFDRALALCDEVLAKYPDDMEALFNRGLSLVQMERYDEAMAAFTAVALNDPNDLRAVHQMAFCLFRSNMSHGALTCMEYVSERAPLEASFALSKADVLSDLGRQEEALELYHSVQLPDEPEARSAAAWGMATCYARKGEFDKAIEQYQAALDNGCEDPECRLMMAQAQMEAGQHQEALDTALKQILLTPGEGTAYMHAARALTNMEQHQEALGYLEQAASRMEDPLNYEKARCLARLDRKDEALAELETLMERQGDTLRAFLQNQGVLDFPELAENERFKLLTGQNK